MAPDASRLETTAIPMNRAIAPRGASRSTGTSSGQVLAAPRGQSRLRTPLARRRAWPPPPTVPPHVPVQRPCQTAMAPALAALGARPYRSPRLAGAPRRGARARAPDRPHAQPRGAKGRDTTAAGSSSTVVPLTSARWRAISRTRRTSTGRSLRACWKLTPRASATAAAGFARSDGASAVTAHVRPLASLVRRGGSSRRAGSLHQRGGRASAATLHERVALRVLRDRAARLANGRRVGVHRHALVVALVERLRPWAELVWTGPNAGPEAP